MAILRKSDLVPNNVRQTYGELQNAYSGSSPGRLVLGSSRLLMSGVGAVFSIDYARQMSHLEAASSAMVL